MKKQLLLSLSLFACAAAMAKGETANPGRVLQCLSGNCENGQGEAKMSLPDRAAGDGYYKGAFRNGLPDGEGIFIRTGYSRDEYYVGHFKAGLKNGYGTSYEIRMVDGQPLPDSSATVSFENHSAHHAYKAIRITPQGELNYWNEHTGKYRENWDYNRKVKDEWVNAQATAFLASRKGKFAPPPKPTEEQLDVAAQTVSMARGRWAMCITWDCLTDRSYYITVTPRRKYSALPFGSTVICQISDEQKMVVAEGEIAVSSAGTRWQPMRAFRPAKPGRYTFLIKYDQSIIGGRADDYVDGMRVDWTLHTYRKL